ncbi:MAG: hypothetical protein HWQ41_21270 [Nostoc sp. NOS(2021)]|uniref:hypothetical protein n=1 Tax=Nostoc sp. NOS(2021) TaxID=2815407 RepID=UPI0025CF0A7B|nr:hypothetical protein [Nostoc sp. NOS(2021)]MBN3897702.1 hypothetical protein [Nostoc sp. NOS(2021)]
MSQSLNFFVGWALPTVRSNILFLGCVQCPTPVDATWREVAAERKLDPGLLAQRLCQEKTGFPSLLSGVRAEADDAR